MTSHRHGRAVPAIHRGAVLEWMAGTSPAMTMGNVVAQSRNVVVPWSNIVAPE
jgi:hypothetical protein